MFTNTLGTFPIGTYADTRVVVFDDHGRMYVHLTTYFYDDAEKTQVTRQETLTIPRDVFLQMSREVDAV